jgi:hypothetical protein
MLEQAPIFKKNFVSRYQKEYSPVLSFVTDRSGRTIEGTSNNDFRRSRTDLMSDYLNNKPKHHEMTQSLLSEELVLISIAPFLAQKNFITYLAPQNLESGGNQKGLDIIIADKNNVAYLGIDVKLKIGRSSLQRDGFGWSPNLQSPYIYLKLGNWSLNTREEAGVRVRDWINTYTVPRIIESGKIPRIFEMRQYLFGRINRSLSGYSDLFNNPKDRYAEVNIPKNIDEQNLLKEKLESINKAFSELDKQFNGQ